MAFGSKGTSRGGRPGMGGGSTSRIGAAARGGIPKATPKPPKIVMPSKPLSSPKPSIGHSSGHSFFGGPVTPPPPPPPSVNINFGSGRRARSGGGLMGSLLSSAVSAGVGVASAAIVNKIHENSQMKIAEKQAEQQAELARQQAEQQAEIARQQAEYQVEIERLKTQQEEIKLDAVQDKRYYANCPYCMGVNNGGKFCQYCGSSLAYYDEDENEEGGEGSETENNQQTV